MKSIFKKAQIQAISTCIPNQKITLEEQVDLLYGGDIKKAQRIKKSIGLDVRYIADEKTTTLDLCFQASLNLFKQIPIQKQEIDAIIFVTQTPDFLQPNNAHLLHGKLNLSQNCACFDLNQGCSGYVYGLFLSSMLIESGARHVLLCAGDTLSKTVDPKDSNTAPIFGDAGSATLISYSTKDLSSFFSIHSDGTGWENIILPNSAFRNHASFVKTPCHAQTLCMDGAEVFNFSIDKEPKAIQEILQESHKNINEIDYIFFHQANAYIISNIARRLDLPIHKAPSDSVGKYGNTSSASIPLAICDTLNSTFRKSQQVILSGFGVGLSWATCLTSLQDDTIILSPQFFNKEKL